MSDFDRPAMIEEANELGIEFKGNISNIKLASAIAEFKGEPEPVDETAPPGPAVKAEDPEDLEELSEVDEVYSVRVRAQERQRSKHARQRKLIADAKAKAKKTQVVTLTNKDPRENEHVTTAYLSVQNQHFAIGKNVPLDIPVELEKCLINLAENAMITLHKDEIKGGRLTGNKVTMRVKKYAISYSPQQT